MSVKNNARFARLDIKGDAIPLTTIVAHIPAGKISFPDNVVDYELRDTNPHSNAPSIGPQNRRERRAEKGKNK